MKAENGPFKFSLPAVCHQVKKHDILYQWELEFNQRKQLCQLKCLVKGGELVFCIVCQSHLDHLKQLMSRKIESRINFTILIHRQTQRIGGQPKQYFYFRPFVLTKIVQS